MTRRGPSGSMSRFRPKKSLGQHFLLDPLVIKEIIACSRFQSTDRVLEIGAGRGELTLPLARTVDHVVAVEKDKQLINLLNKKLLREGISNVTVVHHDILGWDFQEMSFHFADKIQVVGNLPYNISTTVLEKLIANRALIMRAILMFQLEIAKRLTASPGNKTYGAMTVLIQYYAHATGLLEVSKKSFFPKPKVDSMVLELNFERPYPKRAEDETVFSKVVKGAFAHRRKTILNSLNGFFPFLKREELKEAIKKCGVDPGTRAESLDIETFLCLASVIKLT